MPNEVENSAAQFNFESVPINFRDIYERCLQEYRKEAAIWDEIQSTTEVRIRQFAPDSVSYVAKNQADSSRFFDINRAGSKATLNTNKGSFCNYVESLFNTVASGILSYVVPLPEYNVQYDFVGNIPDERITPTPVKEAMVNLGKKVCQIFLDSNSGVHIHLLSAIKDLIRYGQCIIYDRLNGDDYMMQHMDLRDYVFDTDPFTNEVNIIFRKMYTTGRNNQYYVWLKRGADLFPPQGPEDTAPYLNLVLDSRFKIKQVQPLFIMPIRVCRLFNIPNYKFGYGYGQSIINEAQIMQKYTDIRAIAAMRAIKPPMEVFTSNYKDTTDPNTGKTMIEAIMECDAITRNPNVPIGMPLAAPIITHDPNSVMSTDQYMALIQSRIENTLMVSQYLLPQQPNMSAREVSVRAEQKLQLLTPVMSAVMNECVEPTISNLTTKQMMSQNMSAMILNNYRMQLMQETGGMVNIQLRHQTKFDRLRGLAEYNTGEDALNALVQGAQIDPNVMIGVDVDKLTTDRIKNTGVRQDVIRSEQEKAEIMAAQQEAQKEQQNQQMVAQVLGAAEQRRPV